MKKQQNNEPVFTSYEEMIQYNIDNDNKKMKEIRKMIEIIKFFEFFITFFVLMIIIIVFFKYFNIPSPEVLLVKVLNKFNIWNILY